MTEEKNRKRILYIVEDEETAQFGYRVKNIQEAVEKSSKWRLDWILKSKVADFDLSNVDLLVLLRQTAKDKKVLELIKKAHNKNIKVLFDLDDLVFDYFDLPILMRSTDSRNLAYWMGYVWGIRRIARKVDGFIATNDFLGKLLNRSFDKPYRVIPNSLNRTQVEISEEVLNKKNKNEFVIGYFSGSPTHNKDLRLVEADVLRFLNTHNDAKFLIVGYMKLSEEIKKKEREGKVEIIKLMQHDDMLKKMAEVDVNIAPLLLNDFTNCKSELKFFEAAAVETTTIASPTYTFKHAITDGKNGFLAQPGEWYDKLEYLYNNPDENRKIAEAAREYALENYYGKKFLKEVEEAYDSFL